MFDFLLAPGVMFMRMPIIFGEMMRTPSGHLRASRRLESERMVTEKVTASFHGLANASFESVRIQWELSQHAIAGRPQAFSMLMMGAPVRLVQAMSAPAQRTVRANTRRLAARA